MKERVSTIYKSFSDRKLFVLFDIFSILLRYILTIFNKACKRKKIDDQLHSTILHPLIEIILDSVIDVRALVSCYRRGLSTCLLISM